MPPDVNAHYDQIKELLKELKEQGKYETRLSLLEQKLENYVTETDIHKMITAKIEKSQSKRINWTSILQIIIAGVITAVVVAMYMKAQGA